MAKIRLSHPSSTGTKLYGSQRLHRGFVTLSIRTGNCGDHFMEKEKDDTGFKGAHQSTIRKIERLYDKTRPSASWKDQRKRDGTYEIGEFVGTRLVEAPELKGKDDIELIEVSMSFEQFAEMLVSNGHQIDCTLSHIRGGFGEDGEDYREEVTEPPPIYDRAQRRMEKAQAKALAEIDAGLAEIDGWNASKKVKEAARNRLEMTRQHIVANSGFVLKQASEELGSVAEGAVSIIYDKVSELEEAGRLPEGSAARFRSGDVVPGLLLPGGKERGDG